MRPPTRAHTVKVVSRLVRMCERAEELTIGILLAAPCLACVFPPPHLSPRLLAIALPRLHSNPSAAWNEVFNFGPVCADGYGVGYLVHENEVWV